MDNYVVIGFTLRLIGWKSKASFLDQSRDEVKQNETSSGLLSTYSIGNWF